MPGTIPPRPGLHAGARVPASGRLPMVRTGNRRRNRAWGLGSEDTSESIDVTEVMCRVVHRVANDPVRVPLVAIDDDQRAPGRRRQTGEPVVQRRRLAIGAGQRVLHVDETGLGVEPRLRGRAKIGPRLLHRRVEKEPHGEEDLANMIGVLGYGPHIGDGSSEQFVRCETGELVDPEAG